MAGEDVIDGRRTDTRARLVRAATGLFRRYGVASVGVAEVCERAGVTKGVFTHHFPGGKDELVAAVIAANGAEVRGALDVASARARGSLPAFVRQLFDAYASAMRSRGPDFGCPVAAGVVDASARSDALRAAADSELGSWRAAIATQCDRATAELVLAALEGGILLARAAADPAVLRRTGRTLAAALTTAG